MRPWLAGLFCLAGCGSGIGSSDPSLTTAVAATAGQWQVLDLVDGRVTALSTIPDLAANPGFRDRLLVLRLIPGLIARLGQASGSIAAQADETPTAVQPPAFYVAAFELTRAQWQHLAGTTPWTEPGPLTLPATGMSWRETTAALAQFSARFGHRLVLPSPRQWEVAARAGAAGIMPWGDNLQATIAATYARTAAEAGSGPDPVGQRQANAFGLYDCIGNVWEYTDDGAMRGGSWADALSLARPANRDQLLPDDASPAVGLRVVYLP
ncbi:MAG: SUMF1/EgtB/PvdO family nonheme iron enzyme [Caulobacterales bacterium]|nr:SUMF1/EgtB/PvdO family nonheme iron enzyme [Caulobacterales bacterium]